jgi:hypothetical protein
VGADFLYFDGMWRTSPAEVASAVAHMLGREGWTLLDESEGPGATNGLANDYREIAVFERDDWTVVRELDAIESGFPVPWAERLASALDGPCIGIRAWSDEGTFAIERFDGAVRTGSVVYPGEASRPRTRLKAPFLLDVAPSELRAALARGVAVTPVASDHAVIELARLAAIPLLTRYDDGYCPMKGSDDAPTLRFQRPRRTQQFATTPPSSVKELAARPPKVVNLRLRDSFHVRRVSSARLLRELVAILGEARLILMSDPSETKDRDLFIAQSGAWQSFGEALGESSQPELGAGALHTPTIPWGALLSKRLKKRVVMVRAHDTWIEHTVFEDGKPGEIVRAPSQAGSVGAPESRGRKAAARVLGKRLGLEHPVLEGKIEGVVVPFCHAARRPP